MKTYHKILRFFHYFQLVLRCDALNAPKNGKLVGNDFTVGKSVRFECNDGFNLNGATTLNCGVDGKWNSPVPTCEGKNEDVTMLC